MSHSLENGYDLDIFSRHLLNRYLFIMEKKPLIGWTNLYSIHLRKKEQEFSCGALGKGSRVVPAAQVAVVLWVQSLAQEIPHAEGTAKKKKKE